jgi:hypothetical protein
MSTRPGGDRNSGRGVALGAGFAAAKGLGLIAVALVVGIVLLQWTDDGSSGPVGDSGSTKSTTTTSAAKSTTSSVPSTPAKTPEQLRVLTLNAGAPSGSAADMRDALKLKGYTNQADPNDWSGKTQEGDSVMCQPGLEREANALAVAVGEGTPTQEWPAPPPPFTDGVDCVVVVGSPA